MMDSIISHNRDLHCCRMIKILFAKCGHNHAKKSKRHLDFDCCEYESMYSEVPPKTVTKVWHDSGKLLLWGPDQALYRSSSIEDTSQRETINDTAKGHTSSLISQ